VFGDSHFCLRQLSRSEKIYILVLAIYDDSLGPKHEFSPRFWPRNRIELDGIGSLRNATEAQPARQWSECRVTHSGAPDQLQSSKAACSAWCCCRAAILLPGCNSCPLARTGTNECLSGAREPFERTRFAVCTCRGLLANRISSRIYSSDTSVVLLRYVARTDVAAAIAAAAAVAAAAAAEPVNGTIANDNNAHEFSKFSHKKLFKFPNEWAKHTRPRPNETKRRRSPQKTHNTHVCGLK